MPIDHIQLADGRLLDIRVSGPTDGLPLVFHHGTPGAATEGHLSIMLGALDRMLDELVSATDG